MIKPKKDLLPDNRLPAYLQLRDRLAARIAAGEWQAEQALPSENVLTRETGLSVGTVRRAISELVDEGLLERRQGAGTYLRKPAFDATLFRFFSVQSDDVPATIPASRLAERARANAPEKIADILGTEDCVRIERLRLQSDQVLLSEEIWLPYAIFGGIETEPAGNIGPLLYPYYLEKFNIFVARAEDEVSFANATPKIADRLGLEAGGPVARIERTAFSLEGKPIEWRVAFGSATRFRYRSHIG